MFCNKKLVLIVLPVSVVASVVINRSWKSCMITNFDKTFKNNSNKNKNNGKLNEVNSAVRFDTSDPRNLK